MEDKLGPLTELMAGQGARIREIHVPADLGNRLEDMGMIPGTQILCRISGSGRGLGAYEVRGTVLALRRQDAGKITVVMES